MIEHPNFELAYIDYLADIHLEGIEKRMAAKKTTIFVTAPIYWAKVLGEPLALHLAFPDQYLSP